MKVSGRGACKMESGKFVTGRGHGGKGYGRMERKLIDNLFTITRFTWIITVLRSTIYPVSMPIQHLYGQLAD